MALVLLGVHSVLLSLFSCFPVISVRLKSTLPPRPTYLFLLSWSILSGWYSPTHTSVPLPTVPTSHRNLTSFLPHHLHLNSILVTLLTSTIKHLKTWPRLILSSLPELPAWEAWPISPSFRCSKFLLSLLSLCKKTFAESERSSL